MVVGLIGQASQHVTDASIALPCVFEFVPPPAPVRPPPAPVRPPVPGPKIEGFRDFRAGGGGRTVAIVSSSRAVTLGFLLALVLAAAAAAGTTVLLDRPASFGALPGDGFHSASLRSHGLTANGYPSSTPQWRTT